MHIIHNYESIMSNLQILNSFQSYKNIIFSKKILESKIILIIIFHNIIKN